MNLQYTEDAFSFRGVIDKRLHQVFDVYFIQFILMHMHKGHVGESFRRHRASQPSP